MCPRIKLFFFFFPVLEMCILMLSVQLPCHIYFYHLKLMPLSAGICLFCFLVGGGGQFQEQKRIKMPQEKIQRVEHLRYQSCLMFHQKLIDKESGRLLWCSIQVLFVHDLGLFFHTVIASGPTYKILYLTIALMVNGAFAIECLRWIFFFPLLK